MSSVDGLAVVLYCSHCLVLLVPTLFLQLLLPLRGVLRQDRGTSVGLAAAEGRRSAASIWTVEQLSIWAGESKGQTARGPLDAEARLLGSDITCQCICAFHITSHQELMPLTAASPAYSRSLVCT